MVEQMHQKLDASTATDPHRFAVQQMFYYPNDSVLLVRRKPMVHPNRTKPKWM